MERIFFALGESLSTETAIGENVSDGEEILIGVDGGDGDDARAKNVVYASLIRDLATALVNVAETCDLAWIVFLEATQLTGSAPCFVWRKMEMLGQLVRGYDCDEVPHQDLCGVLSFLDNAE